MYRNNKTEICLLLAAALLCGTLTSCVASDADGGGAALPIETPSAPAEPIPPAEPAAEITDNTAQPAEPDGLNAAFIDEEKLYYRDHDDEWEEFYTTILADLSALTGGIPVIALREEPADYSDNHFDEADFSNKNSIWGYDMRGCDVSGLDLSVVGDYNDVTFDSNTVFPSDPAKLPNGFNPERILEFNKNPGLGIRALHEQGVTGEGVGIAIIDQALLLEHEQYRDNLMFYESIHGGHLSGAYFHGSAVSSIAVGKDIGVAPDARLYYISETFSHGSTYDYTLVADAILRVLDINRRLPENEKIRVISISLGYTEDSPGITEVTEAIKKAESENVFVLTTSTDLYYRGFNLSGADRDYLADPDDYNSYTPASWTLDSIKTTALTNPQSLASRIIFPMGSRTYAGPAGAADYEIGHNSGLSWAVPWCAGFYALCCQVKPEITPQEFISLLKETGVPVKYITGEREITFGKMVNPKAVIDALRGE